MTRAIVLELDSFDIAGAPNAAVFGLPPMADGRSFLPFTILSSPLSPAGAR